MHFDVVPTKANTRVSSLNWKLFSFILEGVSLVHKHFSPSSIDANDVEPILNVVQKGVGFIDGLLLALCGGKMTLDHKPSHGISKRHGWNKDPNHSSIQACSNMSIWWMGKC